LAFSQKQRHIHRARTENWKRSDGWERRCPPRPPAVLIPQRAWSLAFAAGPALFARSVRSWASAADQYSAASAGKRKQFGDFPHHRVVVPFLQIPREPHAPHKRIGSSGRPRRDGRQFPI